MDEPIVTIKMTKSEVILLNQMVNAYISDLDEMYQDTGEGEKVSPAKSKLQNDLIKVEEWIDDKIQEKVNDKRVNEESIEEQTQMETSQRVCVLCDD